MSSEQGDLLFYATGNDVYDVNDEKMPNGSGLKGDNSASQSALAIPVPNDPDRYYLFSQSGEILGLTYSIINISLPGNGTINEPLGDVSTEKNILILANTQECLSATPDNNGGYWVITKKHSGDESFFYTFHIDGTTGDLDVSPVVSGASNIDRYGFIGTIKFNPYSSQLTNVVLDDNSAYLWGFDNNTGMVTGTPQTITTGSMKLYGAEYSPNGSYVYINEHLTGNIYRFQTEAIDIQSTKEFVGTSDGNTSGAIQLGPGGKIYISSDMSFGSVSLAVISYPDNSVVGSVGFDANGVVFQGADFRTYLGLPNFVSSFLHRNITLTYSIGCSETIDFSYGYTGTEVSHIWSFGDETTSTMQSPTHTYSEPGTYILSLTVNDAITGENVIYKEQITIEEHNSAAIIGHYCVGSVIDLTLDDGNSYCFYLDENETELIACGETVNYSFTNTGEHTIYANVDAFPSGEYGPVDLLQDDGPWGSVNMQSFTVSRKMDLISFDVESGYSIFNNEPWRIEDASGEIVTSGAFSASYNQRKTIVVNSSLLRGDYTLIFSGTSHKYSLTAGNENSEIIDFHASDWFSGVGPRTGYISSNWVINSPKPFCKPLNLIYEECITGTSAINEEENFFYPNPVNDVIHLSSILSKTVVIYSAQGRQVYSGEATGEIDVSTWSAGLYLIHFSSEKETFVKKFMKK